MGWSNFLPTLSNFLPGPGLSSHWCKTRGPLEASELGCSLSPGQPGGQTSWPGGEAGRRLGKKHVRRLNSEKPSQLWAWEGARGLSLPSSQQVMGPWQGEEPKSPPTDT